MKKTWDQGELIAIEYLKRNDYILIETNYKFSTFWEIDVICSKDELTIFIEVKYRNSVSYGWAIESIAADTEGWSIGTRRVVNVSE